ncbi:MAG TPA: hypothetical protein VK075_03935 [Pseudogracilibacillus sp.]|nr:hypothetical protein [Pseudogracilibacillus sp.]
MKHLPKLFIMLLLLMSACANQEDKENNSEESISLIDFYLEVDEDTTYDDVIDLIKENNLFSSEKDTETKHMIKIAHDEDVTSFNNDHHGDYVQLSYNLDKDKLQIIEYFQNDKFITLFHYIDGLYWEFQNLPQYEGFYINTYNEKAGDFELELKDDTVETDYLKVESKEEQIDYLKEFERKTDDE